jgi:RNA polymerase sigma factor (sigma-70 family)
MQTLINHTVDHLFRHESGKLVSVLSKLLGLQQLELAHDIVQDTLLQAIGSWTHNGVPQNPSAWLHKVARNKAIDYLRRNKNFRDRISPEYAYLLQSDMILTPAVNRLFDEDEIKDSQLKMIFACCHPSIPVDSQAALALKSLCGLNVPEIARAFLSSEETISKRIYRAKEKIRNENISFELPPVHLLQDRLEGVLKCLYLLFNEGYNSSHPDILIREELCEEAIRLCYMLTQHDDSNKPRTHALLALFCFQASRLLARLDDKGHIILLKYQDRSKWHQPLIKKGYYFLDLAITEPFETSAFHLEAAIAAMHASAVSFETTDWKSIYFLYQKLEELKPGPVISLNKAIASAYAVDREFALQSLMQIAGLNKYYIYHTSLAEIHFEMGHKDKAREHYSLAMELTPSRQEKQLLNSKIQNCIE